MSRPSAAPDAASSCSAFVVPLAGGARAQGELAWVLRASAAASVAATAGADQLFVVTSEPVGNGVEARSGPAAAIQPRLLQATTTTATTSPIMITPEVVQGLIVGFILLFITIVGLQCTMNIRTPDVMHSTTLPAGKEY